MTAVYVVDACRTPIGKAKGQLAGVRPDDLTAVVMRALLARTPSLDPSRIDDVYWGAANQAGEDNRNAARMGVLLAGLPLEVPGATVNRLCASGLEAVSGAARAIAAGEADLCLAGGTESMTRAPFVLPRPDSGYPRSMELADTRLGWRLVNPQMQKDYPPISLGETAENVADRYGIGRERQDAFALTSHQRATAAAAAGRFTTEVLPVAVKNGEATADEGPDASVTLEALGTRKPAFRREGTVTGGNSSPLSDGAAGLLLTSERGLAALGVEPLARYVGTAAAGVHPDFMGIGPVPATRKLLARIGWSVDDLDLVELNEAFAAQSLAVVDELKLDPERVNVNGGAIALGHPLGCSGARLAGTLAHEMRLKGVRRGLVSLCIGVGQGLSMALEAA
ncbi:thiolase family protein [Actinacidiphila oryziradicis]|uniref:acetyl-CoA C-acyltransferase n=1 Tax=Actinacidiphila oryziradicis TaxID=2571141 RepID=A0A4U0SBY6_9ACTN|nr:acetyl-CoA C-acyltransferase [Actinacidiphila oryziradicis]TKA04971.1 acetyl-CoA C-acyltransferase [Actinacidiphila oryziradicis]